MERRMQKRQLKTMIDTGHYQLDPALIAEAMLRRRSIRRLLSPDAGSSGGGAFKPADRTPSVAAGRRRAA
jgi:hypothetical protein